MFRLIFKRQLLILKKNSMVQAYFQSILNMDMNTNKWLQHGCKQFSWL